MKSDFVFRVSERWPSCHSSTICTLPKGGLAVAWFAGSKEGSSDSAVLISKKVDSKNWSSPETLVNVAHKAAGNPKLFRGRKADELRIIAPVNYGEWCDGGTRLFMKRSFDGGGSWTDLEILWDGTGILGKNRPIKLTDGTWILPVEKESEWRPAFLRSQDYGESWNLIEVPSGKEKVIQPAIVELSNGNLLAYARSWEGKIYRMISSDKGLSWSKPGPTKLPNNNSGIDMIRLHSGNLLLAFNDTALGEGKRANGERQWGPRNPLSLALSTDEGASWSYKIDIEKKKMNNNGKYHEDLQNIEVPAKGEFSYPSLIQDPNGIIHVVYTYERTAIKHLMATEDELFDREQA